MLRDRNAKKNIVLHRIGKSLTQFPTCESIQTLNFHIRKCMWIVLHSIRQNSYVCVSFNFFSFWLSVRLLFLYRDALQVNYNFVLLLVKRIDDHVKESIEKESQWKLHCFCAVVRVHNVAYCHITTAWNIVIEDVCLHSHDLYVSLSEMMRSYSYTLAQP